MTPELRRQLTIGCLLGAMLAGVLLYLSGLASSVQLGDAALRGFLLVPDLPTPLYITMTLVVVGGVGLTLVASLLQRRRRPRAPQQREPRAPRTPWQVFVSTVVSLAVMGAVLGWLLRHGSHLQEVLERLRVEIGSMHELLSGGTRALVQQVSSPTTGYALFVLVIVVYGGVGLLGLWAVLESWGGARRGDAQDDPATRQVRRAMSAGLRELREHAEPRQAIIACYARLEHLLEDRGVPTYHHLTPQEYMGAVLRGLDLPPEAFAGLVGLFELARYSLHPLDETARAAAITHLEQLTTHLEGGTVHATRA
jgi:hypothetical protein